MIDLDWCFDAFKEYLPKGSKVTILPFTFYPNDLYNEATWNRYYQKTAGL